ncbi:glycoside hydrolase family 99-like domain-containing protein [Ruminococcus sp.]|uniref:glycosyltransferase WbsX family protein n=1 Tax=Ruminococcus sp. TaxID=41978 RepID=UPI0025E8786D|nr:glycoside hydrolase family 99-like domain-containing protein [Ruminococcus sp.]
METKARVIAYYLPQYHPVPENDKMWGKGFTEWTNVAKARPLFRGHYQPQLPADLGFYDLRLPQVRNAQAELAKKYGIEGFCYWHYWFGNGKRILEMPFNEVLKSGKPDFPFCLGWANHSWSNKTWQKSNGITKDVTFLEQTYPGDEDYILHFNTLLPAFKDHRYITVDGKPLFLVFDPTSIPDNRHFIDLWNKLARENGLKGIHFVCRLNSVGSFKLQSEKQVMSNMKDYFQKYLNYGYDAVTPSHMRYSMIKACGYYRKMFRTLLERTIGNFTVEKYDYRNVLKYFYTDLDSREDVYPQLVPRWDKTPRKGKDAEVFYNTTPENFGKAIDLGLSHLNGKKPEHRIMFLFAWNEWGEGAYLEPDIKYGRKHLEMLRKKISKE